MLPKSPIPWRARKFWKDFRESSASAQFPYPNIEDDADSLLHSAGYKSDPDDPMPMTVDSIPPDRPLPPTAAEVKKHLEGMYRAAQEASVVWPQQPTVDPA